MSYDPADYLCRPHNIVKHLINYYKLNYLSYYSLSITINFNIVLLRKCLRVFVLRREITRVRRIVPKSLFIVCIKFYIDYNSQNRGFLVIKHRKKKIGYNFLIMFVNGRNLIFIITIFNLNLHLRFILIIEFDVVCCYLYCCKSV